MDDKFEDLFADLASRPHHRVITPELLDGLPDSELEVAVYDIVWAAKKASREEQLRLIDSLSAGYRATYCTMMLEAEVSNGGFNQYFYNHGEALFGPTVDGYRLFGLDEFARLVAGAAAQYLREAFDDEKARLLGSGRLTDFFESYAASSLDEWDERLWASANEISAARVAYIRRNDLEFAGDFRHLYE